MKKLVQPSLEKYVEVCIFLVFSSRKIQKKQLKYKRTERLPYEIKKAKTYRKRLKRPGRDS